MPPVVVVVGAVDGSAPGPAPCIAVFSYVDPRVLSNLSQCSWMYA